MDDAMNKLAFPNLLHDPSLPRSRRRLSIMAAIVSLTIALPGLAHAETLQRVTLKDVETAIEGTLREEGVGEKLKVSVQASGARSPLAEYQTDIKMYVDKLDLQKDQQRFEALITFEADGRPLTPIKVTGRYEPLQSVPVLLRAIQHGQTIAADDLTNQDIPFSHLRKGTATDSAQLIGQTPLRTISPGRAVRLDELVAPSVITKGTAVTIIFKANHLEIRGLGEALDNGAVGDLVRVKNRDSKQIVQGQVTDAHTVSILSSSSLPSAAPIAASPAKAAVPMPLHAEKRYAETPAKAADAALEDLAKPALVTIIPERDAPKAKPAALEQELQTSNGKPIKTTAPPILPSVIPDTPAPKITPEDLEK